MPCNCLRGDVIRVNLDPSLGSESNKKRPCVVIQNDIGNKYSPITIVVPVTDAEKVPKRYPVDVPIKKGEGGLIKDSVAQCNLIRAIDGSRVIERMGQVTPRTMAEIEKALKISLALT